MTTPDLAALGVHPDDRGGLEHAAAGILGALVVLTGPDRGLTPAVADALAHATLTGPNADLDIRHATPAGDRWTIGEVDEQILAPARLQAFERTHVIIADADQMAPAAFDHLLKAVEDAPSGAQFWFCVTAPDTLPVTIRGRAAASLTARPLPPAARIEQLTGAGLDPGDAARVVAAAGDDTRLALAATTADLLEPLERYAHAPLTPARTATATPTAAADRILADVITLATALPHAAGAGAGAGKSRTPRARKTPARPAKTTLRPRWDTLTPAGRADGRRLVRTLLDRWTAEQVAAVAAADTGTELAVVQRRLQALAAARDELATNAPASLVLPALLSRCA